MRRRECAVRFLALHDFPPLRSDQIVKCIQFEAPLQCFPITGVYERELGLKYNAPVIP
jgi:hypothetical protein